VRGKKGQSKEAGARDMMRLWLTNTTAFSGSLAGSWN